MPANGSESIGLTYDAAGLAAGTYRAQLCLFTDYSYGIVTTCVCMCACVCVRTADYSSAEGLHDCCQLTTAMVLSLMQ